jgi:hypothetical protein
MGATRPELVGCQEADTPTVVHITILDDAGPLHMASSHQRDSRARAETCQRVQILPVRADTTGTE